MSYHLKDETEDVSTNSSSVIYEKTFQVSVFSNNAGNKYQFDNSGLVAEIIGLKKGLTYKFDQSDSSNSNHTLTFSTTSNGTHGGGVEESTSVLKFGIAGNTGAYTLLSLSSSSSDLYYYCVNHSGMGGKVRSVDLTNTSTNELFTSDSSDTVLEAIANRTDYTVNRLDDSIDTWTITGADIGSDTLTGFKRIEFNDGVLALDVDAGDTAGQAYRLYQAAFARTPDMPGVSYHMNDMEGNGLALENVANNFIASPEFKTKYGDSPSDDEFIDLLYQNVLGRSADDDGLAFYKNHFNEGTMTRAAALIGFAESPENISLVAPQIEDGIWLAS